MTFFNLIAATTKLDPIDPVTNAYSQGSTDAVQATINAEKLISNAISGLTILAGLLFIFYFVIGALNWVTAGGEQGKIQKARDQMIQGVIGMIVVVMAYAIMGIVGTFVGLDILHPGVSFLKLRP
jgi:hypothetical protein